MPEYRLTSRSDKETNTEKCPRCLFMGKSFLILSEDVWVCLDCGCHFTSRKRRNFLRDELRNGNLPVDDNVRKIAEAIPMGENESALNPLPVVTDFGCSECGFQAKSKLGLTAHKRSHKDVKKVA